jgi:hypothetical protein
MREEGDIRQGGEGGHIRIGAFDEHVFAGLRARGLRVCGTLHLSDILMGAEGQTNLNSARRDARRWPRAPRDRKVYLYVPDYLEMLRLYKLEALGYVPEKMFSGSLL